MVLQRRGGKRWIKPTPKAVVFYLKKTTATFNKKILFNFLPANYKKGKRRALFRDESYPYISSTTLIL